MADIRVYTLEEVCDILSITKRTAYNYINAGYLNAFKMGKYWRVTEESLRDFTQHNTPVVKERKDQRKVIGDNLKKLRTEKKLTQAELAKTANISRATISAIENGTGDTYNTATLSKLSKALGATVDEVFTIQPSREG